MLKIFELFITKTPEAGERLTALAKAARQFAAASPAIAGFTVQAAVPVPSRKDIVQLAVPAQVDSFAEFWVESEAGWQAALESEAGKAWRTARAATVEEAVTLLTREYVLIPVPEDRPACRNNAFLTRHSSLDEAGFMNEWVGEHGQMCHRIPFLRGFVPCKVLERLPQTDVAEMNCAQVEGIAQAYFDTPEQELEMIGTPEAKAWFAHGARTFGLIKAFGATETATQVPMADMV